VVGEAVHGSASDAWLGWPTVEAATAVGFAYCELVPDVRGWPYGGFPLLEADGHVAIHRGPVGLTYSATVDPIPPYFTEQARITDSRIPHEWASRGMAVCVLNHSDMSFEKLRDLVDSLPAEGRLNWTAAQVARWWARTHSSTRVSIEKIRQPSISYEVRGLPPEAVLHARGAPVRLRLTAASPDGAGDPDPAGARARR
jgi:hypothetical protein